MCVCERVCERVRDGRVHRIRHARSFFFFFFRYGKCSVMVDCDPSHRTRRGVELSWRTLHDDEAGSRGPGSHGRLTTRGRLRDGKHVGRQEASRPNRHFRRGTGRRTILAANDVRVVRDVRPALRAHGSPDDHAIGPSIATRGRPASFPARGSPADATRGVVEECEYPQHEQSRQPQESE